MRQRAARCFFLLLYAAAAVGGIWLTARFLLPWLAPFLVALSLAALMEPLVRLLVRLGWRRSLAAGLMTAAILALAVWAVIALGAWAISAATAFAGQVPELMRQAGEGLEKLEGRALAYIEAAPEGVSAYLKTALASVGDLLYGLPARLSQWALDALGRAAQSSPDALLFAATAGIGTYFFSASFPRTMAFLSAQLPQELKRRLEGLGQDMKGSFGGLLRAQLILMVMTFFQLLLAFLLLGIRGAVGLAAVTAFIDALPVFGTGVVLVPWALYALLLGRYGQGAALLGCWAVVNLVRSCAQAKLLGDQIGLDPIASLLAIYVGWRVWHVWGMLLFPLLLVALCQLNDKGVIRLWKNP